MSCRQSTQNFFGVHMNLNKTRNYLEYLIIIALYYVTGSAFSYTKYSLQITVFFLVSFFLFVFICGKIERTSLIILLFMVVLLLIVPIINNDEFSSYIAIAMQISIGLFCSAIIPLENFIKKYINVIVVFAAISLICFALSIIYPNIAKLFPMIKGDASLDYYNAGVYVFMQPKGYSSFFLFNRNAGICWEPGCYQSFLNIALLLLLENHKKYSSKKFYTYFFILVTTVLTTLSTTGFAALLIILIIYLKSWFKYSSKLLLCIVLVLVSVVLLNIFTGWWEFIYEKIIREFSVEMQFLDRLSVDKIKYLIDENGRFYFFGMSFPKWLTYRQKLWNSIIHSFLCLGTPFTVIQLAGFWQGSKILTNKKYLFFLLIVLFCSTETLFWRVLYSTIAFYGWRLSNHYAPVKKEVIINK